MKLANLLELQNVTKVFGGGLFNRSNVTVAVDDVSFAITSDRPTITAVAGESGSGKTTLSRLLLGVIKPTTGSVIYEDQDVSMLSGSARRNFRREVQPIFQDPFEVYNPFYKADHLLHVAIEKFGLAGSRDERIHLIREALETVGLRPDEMLGRYPHQLSGGQRQRMMVARALLLKPRIILADEPVSMVDASLRATILESIRTLNRDLGISVVYVTHDLTTAYQICDDILVMYKGSVVEQGSVEQVIRDPKHPYTQLLVESIPQMRTDQAWEEGAEEMMSIDDSGETTGCKFADRCPQVMEKCHSEHPPGFATDNDRVAACYLYDDMPIANRATIAT